MKKLNNALFALPALLVILSLTNVIPFFMVWSAAIPAVFISFGFLKPLTGLSYGRPSFGDQLMILWPTLFKCVGVVFAVVALCFGLNPEKGMVLNDGGGKMRVMNAHYMQYMYEQAGVHAGLFYLVMSQIIILFISFLVCFLLACLYLLLKPRSN